MIITPGPLAGVLIISPKILTDERGYFYESYVEKNYSDYGIPRFVQDNYSHSTKNVLRGLHFQLPYAQGKLVSVTRGSVWDVMVDIRLSSKTFGQWFGIQLDETNHTQVYIPPGFAHGFCVLSEVANLHYKCTEYYHKEAEKGICWNDTTLNIPWPIQHPIISTKDTTFPNLSEITQHELFT